MQIELTPYPKDDPPHSLKEPSKTDSKFARWVKKFANRSNIEMMSCIHTNLLVVWVFVGWTTFRQISLLKFDIEGSSHKFKLHSMFQTYIVNYFEIIQAKSEIGAKEKSDTVNTFIFAIFKFCCIVGAIYFNLKRVFKGTKLSCLTKTIGFFLLYDVTLGFVSKVRLLSIMLQKGTLGYKLISILTLILEGISYFFHLNFTQDLRYLKRNIYQGQSYTYYTIKATGYLILIIFATLIEDNSSVTVNAFFNLSNAILAIILLSFQANTGIFAQFGMNSVHAIFDALYLWESILAFLTVFSKTVARSDLDFFSFVGITCLFAILKIYSNKFLQRYLFKNIQEIKDSKTGRLCLLAYYLQWHQVTRNKSSALLLASALGKHTELCHNPYCLCFLSKVFIELRPNSEYDCIKDELNRNIHRIDNLSVANSVAIFKEAEVIKKLKTVHFQIAQIGENALQSRPNSDIDNPEPPEGSIALLNLQSHLQMTRILCSFFVQILDRLKDPISSLFYNSIAFFIYEYNNYLAALVCLYQMANSQRFKRAAGLMDQVKTQNYISIAKAKLKYQQESNSDPFSPKLELVNVLKYKENSNKLHKNNRTLFLQKMDFYQELSSPEVNYKEFSRLGQEIHKGIQETQALINNLLAVNHKNIRLMNENIFFELCVLEKVTISKRLRKYYSELRKEGKLERMTKRVIKDREKLNYFDTFHTVLFASCLNHSFKISMMSSNAPGFFKMSKNKMENLPINALLPKNIAIYHDEFLFHYLNGTSKTRTSYYIESAAVLDSNLYIIR
jgi:hypothetical protein